jgi:hypothetical protein
MGMFDEVYCYATLPDGRDPRGTCFQTKSASDMVWLRFDGSIRLRFSSTIRTKNPTQVRLTSSLGNRGPVRRLLTQLRPHEHLGQIVH